jgi:hypothetical protein
MLLVQVNSQSQEVTIHGWTIGKLKLVNPHTIAQLTIVGEQI